MTLTPVIADPSDRTPVIALTPVIASDQTPVITAWVERSANVHSELRDRVK